MRLQSVKGKDGKGGVWCFEADVLGMFEMTVQLLSQDNGAVSEEWVRMSVDGLMEGINGKRTENGFEALQNVTTWRRLLEMLRMREEEEKEKEEVFAYEGWTMDA